MAGHAHTHTRTHALTCPPAQVRWFSTMLGRLSSMRPLLRRLKELNAHTRSTTLVQGRTRRWVLAWTFRKVAPEAEVSARAG